MGLPITTAIAGIYLNSLIFHNDNKCITDNGQMIINIGANKYVFISHKKFGSSKFYLIYAQGFGQHHMIGRKVYVYGFIALMQFIVYISKLLYKLFVWQ